MAKTFFDRRGVCLRRYEKHAYSVDMHYLWILRYVFTLFCESSTATLNAPKSAVSCIFSEPPTDSRCLDLNKTVNDACSTHSDDPR